jgi:DNA-binding response OmpR family regulator
MEALGRLTECYPDLMILDIGPSEQNGATFIRLARRFGWSGHVIVLSAESGWRFAMREIEADAEVRKPFSPEELLASVDGLLAGRESASRRGSLPVSLFSPSRRRPRVVSEPSR